MSKRKKSISPPSSGSPPKRKTMSPAPQELMGRIRALEYLAENQLPIVYTSLNRPSTSFAIERQLSSPPRSRASSSAIPAASQRRFMDELFAIGKPPSPYKKSPNKSEILHKIAMKRERAKAKPRRVQAVSLSNEVDFLYAKFAHGELSQEEIQLLENQLQMLIPSTTDEALVNKYLDMLGHIHSFR